MPLSTLTVLNHGGKGLLSHTSSFQPLLLYEIMSNAF